MMNLIMLLLLLVIRVFADAQEWQSNTRVLSVYNGLDPLPPRATRLCGMAPVSDQDGMPVTFSVQINSETVAPTAFAVETSSGDIVTPVCATLRPALGPLELRTVLLIGPFSPNDSLELSVEVVQQLEDIDGNSLVGLRGEMVTVCNLSHLDDARDNHVVACVAEISPAISVTVKSGYFHDPGDDANPETSLDIILK